jgi:hypothetical protein
MGRRARPGEVRTRPAARSAPPEPGDDHRRHGGIAGHLDCHADGQQPGTEPRRQAARRTARSAESCCRPRYRIDRIVRPRRPPSRACGGPRSRITRTGPWVRRVHRHMNHGAPLATTGASPPIPGKPRVGRPGDRQTASASIPRSRDRDTKLLPGRRVPSRSNMPASGCYRNPGEVSTSARGAHGPSMATLSVRFGLNAPSQPHLIRHCCLNCCLPMNPFRSRFTPMMLLPGQSACRMARPRPGTSCPRNPAPKSR